MEKHRLQNAKSLCCCWRTMLLSRMSENNRNYGQPAGPPRPSAAAWGFGVLNRVFSIPTVVLAFFLTFQKATLGTGSLSRPGRLVLQQHGDMAFRSLCFSILNLNVVLAFFLTFQKATLGTGSPSQPGRLVLQQDWDLAFPHRSFSSCHSRKPC